MTMTTTISDLYRTYLGYDGWRHINNRCNPIDPMGHIKWVNEKGMGYICPFCRSDVTSPEFPLIVEEDEERRWDAAKYVEWRFRERDGSYPAMTVGRDHTTGMLLTSLRRWLREPRVLTDYQADWLACRSGVHPSAIWHDWFD